MKHRGPIDFLAALVVEFGGLALLLAALPLLAGSGEVARPRQIDPARLPWPRSGNPTPWDDQAAAQRPDQDNPAYVASRLEQSGQRLVQGMVQQIERVLEDH